MDGTLNSVLGTVPLGPATSADALNPVTNRVYVAGTARNSVTVINGVDGSTIDRISTVSRPANIAINPSTNKIYVSQQQGSQITVIDGDTNQGKTINTGLWGDSNTSLTVDSQRNKSYVTGSTGTDMASIDGDTEQGVMIPIGIDAEQTAINPITQKLYVAARGTSAVVEVDVDGKQANNLQRVTSARVGGVETLPAATKAVPYRSSAAFTLAVDVSSLRPASELPPTTLYYRFDTDQALSVVAATKSGVDKATFQIPIPLKEVGLHWVYMYAAWGNDGTTSSAGSGSGSSCWGNSLRSFTCDRDSVLLTRWDEDELGCRLLRGEVKLHVFVTLRMLLPPQLQEKRPHGGKDRLRSMNLGMAARAQGQHQVEHGSTRFTVMHDDGSFVPARGIADAATIPVAFQNSFPQPAKILFILPLERVAG